MSLKEQLDNIAIKYQKGGRLKSNSVNPYKSGKKIKESFDHPYDPDDIRNFFKTMTSSNWYRERLKNNGYLEGNKLQNMFKSESEKNAEVQKIVDRRLNSLSKINPEMTYDNTSGSHYGLGFRRISLNKDEVNGLGFHPRSVIAHEYAHGVNESIPMNEYEVNLFENRKRNSGEYVENPYEAKADIDSMRYNLYKSGDFDPKSGKYKTKSGKFEKSLFDKIKNDGQVKRMRKEYSDSDLEYIMNTVAQNSDSGNNTFYAQKGGSIGKKVANQYDNVVVYEDGSWDYTDSENYRNLYDKGLLYGEDPQGNWYPQGGEFNPELNAYNNLRKNYTFENHMKNTYFSGMSGSLAKGLGQSEDRFWETDPSYKENYEKYIRKQYIQDFFKRNPQNEGEERGAYLDRVTGGLDSNISNFINSNLNPEQQTTYWQDGAIGLDYLLENNFIDSDLEDNIRNNVNLSSFEKEQRLKQLEESPVASRLMGSLETAAPLTVLSKPLQATYRPEYSIFDALQGKKNNASIGEDIMSDVTNLIGGVGLLKNSKYLDEALGTVGKFASDKISNTYKYNPWAFKPNSNSFYRQIDNATYNELEATNGLIKGKQDIGFKGVGNINLNKSFGDDAYYMKGDLYYPNSPEMTHLYEVNKTEDSFIPKLNGRTKGLTTENTNVRVSKEPINVNDPDVNVYQKDWLRGYKKVNPNNTPVENASFMFKNPSNDPVLNWINHLSKRTNDTIISMIPGQAEKAKRALKLGNEWSENWYNHPITRDRLNNIRNEGNIADKRIAVEGIDNIIDKNYIVNFQSNKSKFKRFIDGQQPLHHDNYGISYSRLEEPIDSKYGMINGIQNFVDKHIPPVTIKSTTIHEGNHGIFPDIDPNSQMGKTLSSVLDPYELQRFDKKYGIEKSSYYSQPEELYARIQEIRAENKIQPGDIIDDNKILNIMEKGLNGKSNVQKEVFRMFDTEKLRDAMNKLPATTIGIGGAAGAYSVSKDNFQEGGKTGREGFKEQMNNTRKFFDQYLNSDRYKKLLKKEWEGEGSESFVDEVIYPQAMDNYNKALHNISLERIIEDDPNILGIRYSVSPNYKIKDDYQYQVHPTKKGKIEVTNYGLHSNPSVITHEVSHAIDNGGAEIPYKTIEKLASSLRGVKPYGKNIDGFSESVRTMFRREYNDLLNDPTDENLKTAESLKSIQDYFDNYSNYRNFSDNAVNEIYDNVNFNIPTKYGTDKYPVAFSYQASPTEFKARLQSTREKLFRKGIYNAAERDFTEDDYDKLIEDFYNTGGKYNNPDIYEFLDEVQGEFNKSAPEKEREKHKQGVIWMMNNLAKNNTDNNTTNNIAQKGGSIKQQLNILHKKYGGKI